MLNSKSQVETTVDSSSKVEVTESSHTCTKPLVGCSFSLEELEPKEDHIYWDVEQLENFDKKFQDFKHSIDMQIREFGLKNKCRVIILDGELRAIIDIRKPKNTENTSNLIYQ